MKDLKHMIYFEKLLDSACNDLVREAQKENRVAVGYTCFHIPEVLLNLDHCFSQSRNAYPCRIICCSRYL